MGFNQISLFTVKIEACIHLRGESRVAPKNSPLIDPRPSYEELRSLFENALDVVIAMDATGAILEWNNQAELVFGWKKRETIGKVLSETIVPIKYRDAHTTGLKEFLKTGQGKILNHRLETTGLRKDGTEFPVELTVTPVKAQNGFFFYAFLRELTVLKKNETEKSRLLQEAEKNLRLRDEFISIAAHELKTPLTSLSIQIQMLNRYIPDCESFKEQKIKGLIKGSQEQILRFTNLVENLLDVSRASAGILIIEKKKENLSEIVRQIVETYQVNILKAHHELELHLEASVIGMWDKVRIEQVIINLLSNAIKYGEGKPITIMTKIDGEKAILTVRDHGIGIAEQDKERIFNRYERAVSKQDFSGLGLGLYITRQIVIAHGGSIYFESRPKEGSTFTVELPLLLTHENG